MERILVIEDDPNIRESLMEILELAGYDRTGAQDGREGYNAIIESPPDLVICDVNMPELSGFELLEAINQKMRDQVIPPFLFLTAKVEPKDIRHGMNLGADDYLLKPFDHNNLLKTIRLRLDKRNKILEKQEGNSSNQEPSNRATLGKIALPSEEGLTLVPIEEIIRCEADRAYCKFHLNNGSSILVSKSMKEFEQTLFNHNFFKTHKSNIVNMHYVEKYLRGKGGQLLMKDGSIVQVSVRRKEELMKILKAA